MYRMGVDLGGTGIKAGIVEKETGKIIMAACSDSALGIIPNMLSRNAIRANIFKKILMSLI